MMLYGKPAMNIHECGSCPKRELPPPGPKKGLAVLMSELRVNLRISLENTTDEDPEKWIHVENGVCLMFLFFFVFGVI